MTTGNDYIEQQWISTLHRDRVKGRKYANELKGDDRLSLSKSLEYVSTNAISF